MKIDEDEMLEVSMMKNKKYVVHLEPEEFDYMLEDIALAYHSAQKKCFVRDKFGREDDLTDYGLIKLLKDIGKAFEKADKEHKCIDEINQLTF